MSKTILIVDDSNSLRQVVNQTLSQAGYDILEADDGTTALTLLDSRKIHLIVSDVNMPRMDGLTFVRHVRDSATYRFTPVIMLTTECSPEMKAKGRAAGAHAWIVKPFNPQSLLSAVARLVLP